MNIGTLLFPGTALPYHVVDYAIKWAKENEGSLHTLFVLSGNSMPSGDYPFPNDFDGVESLTTDVDASRGVRQLLQQEIRFIEKRAKASHISVRSEVLFSPTIEQVLARVNHSDIIFIDKNLDDHSAVLDDLHFSFEDLREKATRHFHEIGEFDRYSDVFY